MKPIYLNLIRFYQNWISFDTGLFRFIFGTKTCRFTPTCSHYLYEAIQKYGILHGSLLGFKRFFRCHPGHPGGFDPVK